MSHMTHKPALQELLLHHTEGDALSHEDALFGPLGFTAYGPLKV